ncbi:hypothetical protein KY363_00515 [Candidatus Woesearchaeota archaeon]|nr:hypothetical protein [Candidatus Woesearchaeota archaeon]
MQDRDTMFRKIKEQYALFEQSLKDSGRGLVYRTEKGIYGTTNLDNIFMFFKEINLQNYRHFLDLGCGDGRVVLVASLFTKATGIEYSAELLEAGIAVRDRLGLSCGLVVGDYLSHDFSGYDIVFINPDHDFGELNAKLARELNGPLFIYNEIFSPEGLVKGRKFWYGQLPIVKYARTADG